VKQRLQDALGQLVRLYPQSKLPPVTIAVGRGKPVAIGSPVNGVQIGLEALCAADRMNSDPEERFVHVTAHEYAHVQQIAALVDDDTPTVIEGTLIEGIAEFIAELTTGEVGYRHLALWSKGHEYLVESQWINDLDSKDLSRWLYNGFGDEEWPGDLGYWVGYRVAKAYYRHGADKKRAIRDLLEMTDPHAILAHSGWYPGIPLP